MIRKQKLAIVVAGVLLLAGVAFGAPRPSNPIVYWTEGDFTCTSQTAAPGSRETKQYIANLAEQTRLWARRSTLQNDINILENTCNTLPRRQQVTCRQGVNELRSIERSLDKINHDIIIFSSCSDNDIAWSHPKTRLSFSPYRNTEKQTIVPGTERILGEWTLSTNKGTATIDHLKFQVMNMFHCDIFAEYELRYATGKVLSTAITMDGVMRFDINPNFIVNVTGQKIQLVGRGVFDGNRAYDSQITCSIEMGLTDVARSRIATEGDNSGFGPYGYLYEVLSVITPCPLYSLPVCLEGQEIASGGIGADGCPLPSVCKDTYSWMVGSWGACNNNIQARSVTCQNNFLGSTVASYYCSSTQPAFSQSCNVVADPLCTLFPELYI